MRFVLLVLTTFLALAAIWLLSRDILPPKHLILAAGPEDGGYWHIAERYRSILAVDGIEVELVETAGSVENAELLTERRVEAALLQGGIRTDAELETLGAIFPEPLFLFARVDADLPLNPAEWSGLTIAADGEGSGTRAAAMAFLRAARLPTDANTLAPEGGPAAAEALLAGEVDLAVFVAPLSAPYLAPLFRNPETVLLRLDHIAALSRRMPQSNLIDLPSGAFSLSPPMPAEDLRLIGMVARLAALPGLHPSLVDRLVEAARRIHSGRDAITDEGEFPTMDFTSLPRDAYAGNLLRSGPSRLQQYLPYWVVAQINRFAILLLPILFLLLPLLRALPGLYRWRMRSRVFRHYASIRAIDKEAHDTADPARLEKLDADLAAIDEEIAALRLPLPHRDYAYTARLHIDLLRKKIAGRLGSVRA